MAEVLRLAAWQGVPESRVWAVPRASPVPRRVGRLLAARPDPAVVLVPRRRGLAVLARQPPGPRAIALAIDACTPSGGRCVLIFLGIFLRSVGEPQTNFTFEDTLTQIGLGYVFLFLLGLRPAARGSGSRSGRRSSSATGLRSRSTRCPARTSTTGRRRAAPTGAPRHGLRRPTGTRTPTSAWAFDTWFLNLFPRDKPFTLQRRRLRHAQLHPDARHDDPRPDRRRLAAARRAAWREGRPVRRRRGRAAGRGVGGWTRPAICPIVKRIWTPSWVLFSGGWCFLLSAGFSASSTPGYPGAGRSRSSVIGMNSIAAYCRGAPGRRLRRWIRSRRTSARASSRIRRRTSRRRGLTVLAVYWLILFWMYRQRIFVRI